MFTQQVLKLTASSIISASALLISLHSGSAFAQLPVCSSPSSDSDGDGYGWENNRSCVVNSAPASNNTGNVSNSGASGFPICSSASSDPDGDGYGFENNRSCIVNSNTGSQQNIPSVSASSSGASGNSGLPECRSNASDPDNDGFGF